MDIYEIRRNNLRAIVDALAEGKQARMAEKLARPANLISRYLKTKNIGDDFARLVEEAYGLQLGCMDTPFEVPAPGELVVLYGVPVTKESVDIAHEIDKLPPELQSQVAQLVHTMVKHHKLAQRFKKPAIEHDPPPPPTQQNARELTQS
ncbi:MAG: hypothetical protein RI988_2798 [Pseudomonadota bacterium]|jgi:hypothetical protein